MLKKPLADAEALRLSVDLWEYLARTGLDKLDAFDDSQEQRQALQEYGYPQADCWLCENHYDNEETTLCATCPLAQAGHCCLDKASLWEGWDNAENSTTRKPWAVLILGILKGAVE